MKTFILTDIHGCSKELNELLESLKISSEDRIVLLGDLVDKGPDSLGVIRTFAKLKETNRVDLVMSNHEWKFHKFCAKFDKNPSDARRSKNADEFEELKNSLTPAETAFLRTATAWVNIPEYSAIGVHAGIEPKCKKLPREKSIFEFEKKKIDSLSPLWYCRHVNTASGLMIPLGKETAADPFWAAVYDGRFGHVFYGHSPYMLESPRVYQHATGLDLGCVQGGKLCAGVIENSQLTFQFVSGFAYVNPRDIYPPK